MLKLGVIDVLNVLPVYYGILSQKVEVESKLVFGKVTELNKKLNQGEIDCSVISSFEYAQNPDKYFILPNLSVSADGAVKSIYLFLKKPLSELKNDTINLTESSLTSVNLIQYLLKDFSINYIKDNKSDSAGELLIADEAISRFYQKRDAFVYDLSELWKKKTGLPFVFALWVVRRDVYKNNPEEVKKLYQNLIKSKEISKDLLMQAAQDRYHNIFPNEKLCYDYLVNLHSDFSEPYQQGFNLFQEKMVKIKRLQNIAKLSFLPV